MNIRHSRMVRSFYCGYEDIATAVLQEANFGWDEEVTQDIQSKHLA